MTQVDLELREKWLQALESGKYKQGRGSLNKNGNFCCLGVACEVAGFEVQRVMTYEDSRYLAGTAVYKIGDDDREWYAYIPSEFSYRLGIYDYAGDLAAMNDEGKSFKEIAAFIREQGVVNTDAED